MANTPNPTSEPNVSPVTIEEEMRRSYLDYAMSVIVARALPDVRDGLKPVHRRIIHAMNEGGYTATRPFRKSARIVGDVMGKYHPHGDSAIYDAMVRMAQDFSMRLPLIQGQGNFGSMDGDKAAAMRYTEARLAVSAQSLVDDIDKDTVDFTPNYDETIEEPSVLPARFPNLLVNGAGGIAVGMATNIPCHNLGEVVDATCAVLDNPAITIDELIESHIPGPDFPTGGIVLGRQGILGAFKLGRGSITLRGRTHVEEIRKDRQAIVVTEVPYQVNKARMVEIIAEAVRDKKIEGISDLRDESDRDGVRVVIELKRDAEPDVVLNQLYRFTPLQTSFGVQMLALNNGKPELLNLKQILEAFITFREEVIRRRTIFLLGKAREKAHVLAGLAVAVANIDEVIRLIREAADPQIARARLLERSWPAADITPLIELLDEPDRKVVDGHYRLSDAQARAILDLRLHRLTGLERDKIADDLRALGLEIEDYLGILGSRTRLRAVLRDELVQVRAQFANPRRTELREAEFEHDIEDLIQREDMIVTVTNTGYIKRVPLSAYRAQRRGGRGRAGMSTRDEDFVSQVFVVNTHTPVLFFTSAGMVFKLKVYRLPLGSPQSRGKAMVNLLPLGPGETISTLMPLPEDESTWSTLCVLFATASGSVRRNQLSDFVDVKSNGKIAMRLDEGDRLVRVRTCAEDDDVLLFTRHGRCVRFPVPEVRVFSSRTSTGVRGVRLADGDEVIGLSCLKHSDADVETRAAYLRYANALRRAGGEEEVSDELADATGRALSAEEIERLQAAEEFVLTVTEKGFGKRTSSYEYRVMGRGVQGVATIEVNERNGNVVAAFPVIDSDQLVMVTDAGQLIRIGVDDIRIAGRKTQGVTLFKVGDGGRVVSVTRLRDIGDNGDAGENGDSDGENGENGGDGPDEPVEEDGA